MKKWCLLISGLAVVILWWAPPGTAKIITVFETDSAAGWDVYKDNIATASISVTTGPNSSQQALELKYDMSGGNWIAWAKKIPGGLPGLKAVIFEYRGEGSNNLEVKLSDGSGATFGVHIPGGTDVPGWKKIVIPIDKFEWRWGGKSKVLDPAKIRKFEFTAAIASGGPGYMLVSNVQYSTTAMKSSIPAKSKKKTAKRGAAAGTKAKVGTWSSASNIEIKFEKEWAEYIDKGAALTKSVVDGPTPGKKAIRAVFTWGLREIPGVQSRTGCWAALVKEIAMDFSEVRNIIFTFKSTGAVANLEIKLKDANDCTYGKTYPSGSSASSWTTISVSRSDFRYLWGGDVSGRFDWSHVKAFEFALSRASDPRTSGSITVGDIKFESAVIAPSEMRGRKTGSTSGQIKVIIDGFTDLNPNNRYFVIPGDDSSLNLESSRMVFESEYSMRMQYNLKSTRPTGSWVEARRRFVPPLDWTGAQAVRLWVKGDASQNILRLTLVDGDGCQWICDNQKVMAATDWFLIDMPVEAFTAYRELYKKRSVAGKLKKQLHTIQELGIGIVSQSARNSLQRGEIYIEKIYIAGKGINSARAVPLADKPPLGIAMPLKNWNIGGISNTILESNPTNGTGINQNVGFKLMGNFKKFSVMGEIRLDSEFGNSSDDFRSEDAKLVSPNLSATLLDPIAGVSNIIVGNLWFNSSPHIFANDNLYGGWGFKGLMMEGWVDKIHHRTYLLFHKPNSYSLAGHYAVNLNDLNINLIGTYYNQQPFIASATKLEEDDKALLLDISQKIMVPQSFDVVLRLLGGYDWYQKYWDVGTQTKIDQRLGGSYLRGELNFSELHPVLWPGLSLTGSYCYVEPDYKPTFRQHPGYWDIEFGDQKGYDLRLHQALGNACFSCEYEKIDRISSFDQHRERTRLSIGYNNWASMDITLSQEFASKVYHYEDVRFLTDGKPTWMNEDKREEITILYVAYHFSGVFTLSQWLQFKKVLEITNDEKYTEMLSTMRITYYPAPNLSISLENKFGRYGSEQRAPVIDPDKPEEIDQYTRVRIDLTF